MLTWYKDAVKYWRTQPGVIYMNRWGPDIVLRKSITLRTTENYFFTSLAQFSLNPNFLLLIWQPFKSLPLPPFVAYWSHSLWCLPKIFRSVTLSARVQACSLVHKHHPKPHVHARLPSNLVPHFVHCCWQSSSLTAWADLFSFFQHHTSVQMPLCP